MRPINAALLMKFQNTRLIYFEVLEEKRSTEISDISPLREISLSPLPEIELVGGMLRLY